MPSQQRFEGPVLEDLIEDVRRRFGPEVDIVEANKIRSGGVGGFFARELFELVVEVDDDQDHQDDALASIRSDTAPARSLLDLVDAVDDGPAPARAPAHLRTEPADRGHDAMASEDTIQALLRKTEEPPLPDESPREDDHIAQLLRRLSTPPPTAPADRGTTVSTDGAAFADVLQRISRSAQPAAPASAQLVDDEPFRSFADTARRAAASQGPAPVQPSPESVVPTTPAEDLVAAPPATVPARPARGMRRRELADDGRPVDGGELLRLGLPPELVAGRSISARDRLGTLIEIAESLPAARRLPDAPNTVIALVGDRLGMQHAIEWIQESLCLSPERLMLATRTDQGVFPRERRITSHEDAANHRQSWRRRRRPVLVAVDAPVGLAGASWARHVLDALEPHAVWGVVDAGRKPEDLVEWSERIGGVDAVAVHGTANTSSPASVLTTGLPVSLVDGSAATPARWAAILDERLAA